MTNKKEKKYNYYQVVKCQECGVEQQVPGPCKKCGGKIFVPVYVLQEIK